MIKKKFFTIPLFLLLAACSKNSEEVLPVENSKIKGDINAISGVGFMEYLGYSTSEGNVNLHTINAQGGNLYVYLMYTVGGEVSRVKANGVAQLDVNNLTVSGAVSHSFSAGIADSSWVYDVTAIVQSFTVSKAYTVGLNYSGQISGSLNIIKRRKNIWPSESEFSSVNFSKNFSGVVPPPPPPEIQ